MGSGQGAELHQAGGKESRDSHGVGRGSRQGKGDKTQKLSILVCSELLLLGFVELGRQAVVRAWELDTEIMGGGAVIGNGRS